MRVRQSLRIATDLWLAIMACAFVPACFCQDIEQVQPVEWSRLGAAMGVSSNDTFGQTLAIVLQNEARYELKWVGTEQSLISNLPRWEGVECYAPRFDAYNYE